MMAYRIIMKEEKSAGMVKCLKEEVRENVNNRNRNKSAHPVASAP